MAETKGKPYRRMRNKITGQVAFIDPDSASGWEPVGADVAATPVGSPMPPRSDDDEFGTHPSAFSFGRELNEALAEAVAEDTEVQIEIEEGKDEDEESEEIEAPQPYRSRRSQADARRRRKG